MFSKLPLFFLVFSSLTSCHLNTAKMTEGFSVWSLSLKRQCFHGISNYQLSEVENPVQKPTSPWPPKTAITELCLCSAQHLPPRGVVEGLPHCSQRRSQLRKWVWRLPKAGGRAQIGRQAAGPLATEPLAARGLKAHLLTLKKEPEQLAGRCRHRLQLHEIMICSLCLRRKESV